jgi:hypothetical protein
MSFQKPDLAWLFLVLLVPLLLYLLPMPRRRVMSTALFLWERFLESEILGRTSERFRRALGLALLAAILAALIAAAAELSIGKPAVEARRLVVLMDVSASMNAFGAAVSAAMAGETPAPQAGESNLEAAKRAAADLVASLDATTEVAVAEAAGELRLLSAFQPAGREAADAISAIEPFDGPINLRRLLDQAFEHWGEDDECEIYVFTDSPLPESRWNHRAHAWSAPPAGDNVAITALAAERRGKRILVRYTLANYSREPKTLAGSVLVNDSPRSALQGTALGPGETARQQAAIEESDAATLKVRLDTPSDALLVDNEACIRVPALEDLRANVIWPSGGKHNAYVSAVLSSLQEQGTIGPIAQVRQAIQPDMKQKPPSSLPSGAAPDEVRLESLTYSNAPLTVFVNQSPGAWPEGGAIVLHPLRGGALAVSGLHPEPVTITRQAAHPLLDGVELRGLVVKDAVHAEPPSWAEPIVWAGDLPLVWAGEHGKTKALIVALPLTTDDSRLPLLASFPVLMRNACLWMLPQPKVLRPGETADGWTSRRAGLVENSQQGQKYAFSTLSAAESDLRREPAPEEAPVARRRSLAMALVGLAVVLLTVEWGLFHRRLTE